MGGTLDIREAQGVSQSIKQRTRVTRERRQSSEVIQPAQEARGMLGQGTIIGLPMLQEARTQA